MFKYALAAALIPMPVSSRADPSKPAFQFILPKPLAVPKLQPVQTPDARPRALIATFCVEETDRCRTEIILKNVSPDACSEAAKAVRAWWSSCVVYVDEAGLQKDVEFQQNEIEWRWQRQSPRRTEDPK